jgi:hypothetical protein
MIICCFEGFGGEPVRKEPEISRLEEERGDNGLIPCQL